MISAKEKEMRFVIVDSKGKPVDRVSYPNETAAKHYRKPGQRVIPARVVSRGPTPFQEYLEPVEVESQDERYLDIAAGMESHPMPLERNKK